MKDNFYCSKCNASLKLDDSLLRLSQAQINLLTNKGLDSKDDYEVHNFDPNDYIPPARIELYNRLREQKQEAIHEVSFVPSKNGSNPHPESGSFVMLSNHEKDGDKVQELKSNSNGYQTISSRLNTLKTVFQILSTNQGIDHPLCTDCADLVLSNYKLKFDETQIEKEHYMSFLRRLKEQDVTAMITDVESKLNETLLNYRKYEKEEEDKLNELQDLERQKEDFTRQLSLLTKEMDGLKSSELDSLLKLRNTLNLDLNQKRDRLESYKSLYQVHLNRLDRLRSLNIYTRLFHITFDSNDDYGRINGFRLGYRVPWPEINAALGQVSLLLSFLIGRFHITLEGYSLVPMGSTSYITKYGVHKNGSASSSKTTLNLYCSNEFSIGKLFNYNKLDLSMIATLDIIAQIQSFVLKMHPEVELPYVISQNHDQVGGKSIRVSSMNEWTVACKFLLTDLNWLLTFASAYSIPST